MEHEVIKIPAPGNLAATLAKVKAKVEKREGRLEGDERSGTIITRAFTKDDIQGEYSLNETEIIIKITRKPPLAPSHLIKKEIIEIFKKCAVDAPTTC